MNQKEISDLYKWLPVYGENSVSFRSDKTNIILTVVYDVVDASLGEYASREIIFKSVCSFEMLAFPGIIESNDEGESFQDNKKNQLSLGGLYEYTGSSIANTWTQHFKNQDPVRHFQVFFLAENKRFEIFSREVAISDAEYFSE